jgi:hypothetical protein
MENGKVLLGRKKNKVGGGGRKQTEKERGKPLSWVLNFSLDLQNPQSTL